MAEKTLGRRLGVFRTSYTKDFKPTLEGYHFRFDILLPITEQTKRFGKVTEKSIFNDLDLNKIEKHFNRHFGGHTSSVHKRYSKEDLQKIPKELLPFLVEIPIGVPHVLTSSSIKGSWVNENGDLIVNKHARYEVYTLRHNNAMEYFKKLRKILEEHSKEKIIMAVQAEVTIVPTIPNDTKILLRKVEKLGNEKEMLRKENEQLKSLMSKIKKA
jgi:hypothetical protein